MIANLKICGRTVTLRYGLPAVIGIFQHPEDIFDGNSYSILGMVEILYQGYKNECKAKGVPLELTHEDFYTLVEDQKMNDEMADDISAAIRIFEESRATGKVVDKVNDIIEEKKSLLTGMKLNHLPLESSA